MDVSDSRINKCTNIELSAYGQHRMDKNTLQPIGKFCLKVLSLSDLENNRMAT